MSVLNIFLVNIRHISEMVVGGNPNSPDKFSVFDIPDDTFDLIWELKLVFFFIIIHASIDILRYYTDFYPFLMSQFKNKLLQIFAFYW